MKKCIPLVLLTLALSFSSRAQYVQNGNKLVGTGSGGWAYTGSSVALSADSSTLVLGAIGLIYNSYSGGAFVYTRQGNSWVQQAMLEPTDNVGYAQAGMVVAISGDGNTIIMGGPMDNDSTGAAWVFTRTGTTWTQQAKLTDNTLMHASIQGAGVALSGDGNTALVGAPGQNYGVGAVLVYTRTGTTWNEQSNLVGTGFVGAPLQGSTVSISYNGTTAAWVGRNDNAGIGAAWVFTFNGTVWNQQGSKLNQGFVASSVSWDVGCSLSGDGLTLAVGDQQGGTGWGCVHIFKLQSGAWVQQPIVYSNNYQGLSQPSQGDYISLSYNGRTLAFTGQLDNQLYGLEQGHAYIYTDTSATGTGAYAPAYDTYGPPDYIGERHIAPIVTSANGGMVIFGDSWDRGDAGCGSEVYFNGTAWTPVTPSIFSTGNYGRASLGCSLAISADGNTILTGGRGDQTIGSAWAFKKNGGTWAQYGNKFRGAGASYSNGFGSSLALTANGSNALVAGLTSDYLFYSSPIGVYPFTDNGTGFVQSGDSINAQPGETLWGDYSYGAVAISRDGNTMMMSAVTDNNDTGAAWAFSKSGNSWVLQGDKLVGSHTTQQGYDVALSAHGDVAVITNYGDTSNFIFRLTGGHWQQQFVIGSHSHTVISTVASISDDGLTVAIGDGSDSASKGSVSVCWYNGTSWALQAKLRPNDGVGASQYFGGAVSLSADGNTLAVGSQQDGSTTGSPYLYGPGACYIFKRNGATWQQIGGKIIPSDTSGQAGIGSAVALTPDANTLVIGGANDYTGRGAIWVYNYTGLRIITDSVTSVLCSNANGGAIFAHATGGSAPYTYRWSVPGTSDTLTNLAQGFYYLTAYDAGNDSATMVFNITLSNTALIQVNGARHPSCNGEATGTATLQVTGGTPPYQYNWATVPVQTDSAAVNLAPGAYNYTVTDAANCQVTGIAAMPYIPFWTSGYAYNANCQSSNGSIIIYPYGGTAPYAYAWSNGSTANPLAGVAANTYVVTVTDSIGCTAVASLTVDSSCLFYIEGQVYADANSNCVRDTGEAGIGGVLVIIGNGQNICYANTQADGSYVLAVTEAGTYNVIAAFANDAGCYGMVYCDSVRTVVLNNAADTVTNVNFGVFSTDSTGFDLAILPAWTPAVPGGIKGYWFRDYNNSATHYTGTDTVYFNYDPSLVYLRADTPYPAVVDTINHLLTWYLTPPLYGNQSGRIESYFYVPASLSVNDHISDCFSIYPKAGDCDTGNNSFCYLEAILGSHDPNYKTCSPDSVIGRGDSVLTYTIGYQNTGNDTAHFIVIKDTLSQYVDPTTVQTLASTFAPYTFTVSQTGILNWTFDPIALPQRSADSVNSNGFIVFSVRLKPNLVPGTVVSNTASIYFDYNTPVQTNTQTNVVAQPLAVSNLTNNIGVTAYPNPFSDITNIEITGITASDKYNFELYDVTGRLQLSIPSATSNHFQINRGKLAAGVYTYRLMVAEGNATAFGKLVIE